MALSYDNWEIAYRAGTFWMQSTVSHWNGNEHDGHVKKHQSDSHGVALVSVTFTLITCYETFVIVAYCK